MTHSHTPGPHGSGRTYADLVSALVRAVGVVLATVLLSGCGLAWVWTEPVHRAPTITPAPTTPESSPAQLDDRTARPYTGTVAGKAGCMRASKRQLALLEEVGGVGGSVTYPVGVLVRSNAGWWTAAVATRTTSGADSTDRYALFVTSYPTYGEDPDHEPFAWQLKSAKGDAAAHKALACVKKLPVPKVKPDPYSAASYTGALARGAKCRAVSAKLLVRLQEVGGVGGAITYSEGRLVRSNGKWWTVAVATRVNPNSLGYTRDNVAPTALFVTNIPTGSKLVSVSFPITLRSSDRAAKKALSCLS